MHSLKFLLYNGPLYSSHLPNAVSRHPKLVYNGHINGQNQPKMYFCVIYRQNHTFTFGFRAESFIL